MFQFTLQTFLMKRRKSARTAGICLAHRRKMNSSRSLYRRLIHRVVCAAFQHAEGYGLSGYCKRCHYEYDLNPELRGECGLCLESVADPIEAECFGCGEYICDACDTNTALAANLSHEPEEHEISK